MSARLEFTVLGCGSSGGVPRADGAWGACDPAEPRNARTRCSLMVRRLGPDSREEQTTLLVDTSPDFRLQMVAAEARRMDAVLFTHDHADQSHGIDDLRVFALRSRRRVACHMDAATHGTLIQRFGYIFNGEGAYPPICDAIRMPEHGESWSVDGPSGAIPVLGFDQDHGAVRSVGFRFGPVAYSADVLDLPPQAYEALSGVDIWIVDALRYAPHPTHAHLARTLEWIERVKPARAILTNLHIDMDFKTLQAELPSGVEPAYDGLRFEAEA